MFSNHDDAAFVHPNGTERHGGARTTRRQLWDFDRSYQLSYTGQCGVVDDDGGEGGGGVGVGAVFGVSNYFLPLYYYHLGQDEVEDEEVARLYVFDSGGGSLEQAIDST